jgi:hypothetical protein
MTKIVRIFLCVMGATGLAAAACCLTTPSLAIPTSNMQVYCKGETARKYNVTFQRVEPGGLRETVQGYTVVATIDHGRTSERRVRCDFDVGGTFVSVTDAPPGSVIW